MNKKYFAVSFFAFLISHQLVSQNTISDIDGNQYNTVTIGEQEWMAENLRVTRYRNGDEILFDQGHNVWQQSVEGIWTYYDEDENNDQVYGKLYNWYAVSDNRGLCPVGWRIPTDADWQELVAFIDPKANGNNNKLGTRLRSKRQVSSPLGDPWDTEEHPRWDSHGKRYGTDDHGFNAIPGGSTSMGNAYVHLGKHSYFWSLDEPNENTAWARVIRFSHRGMSRTAYFKQLGFSVRCIKGNDLEPEVNLPGVRIVEVEDVNNTEATVKSSITDNGGSAVTARGLVWSTSNEPTLENNSGFTEDGTGWSMFTSNATGLSSETTYFFRAYATNSKGTSYSEEEEIEMVNWDEPHFEITINISPENAGSVTGAGYYTEGSTVDLTATPNEGYQFVNWTTGDEILSTESTFSYTMPAEDVTITAHFEPVLSSSNNIIVLDTSGNAGDIITITVEMENSDAITAFQMDFELPEGFQYVEESFTLTERMAGHEQSESVVANNTLRILAWSNNNAIIEGNEGTLFTFDIGTPHQEGSWELTASNVNLTNTQLENVFNESIPGTITLAASNTGDHTIQINDATGNPGSDILIEVEMNNLTDITAFQMDIELPEGFEYVDGSYTLSDRSQGHASSHNLLENNVLRLVGYSLENEVFLGDTGVLLTFMLTAPDTEGEYPLTATNVNLTNTGFENVFDGVSDGMISVVVGENQ